MKAKKNQNEGRSSPEEFVSKSTALTEEGRENELISLAYHLAEQHLREGTATSQEIVHFLKLGSTKDRLEKEMMALQMELVKAKTEAYQSTKDIEELYSKALDAFQSYRSSS